MTLAPWIGAQVGALLAQRGHAWLLQGPSGLGQYELALELLRAWLCQQPSAQGACGCCASCHAIDVRTHADASVLMPETVMLQLGWPLGEKAQAEIDDKKRKPSKEIRVEAMRESIEFSQRTSAWGRGKAVLVYPAERMNHVSANALLKTLEEPPGDVRFVLASEAAHLLLPTIRSRCLGHAMAWPDTEEAIGWMASQGQEPDAARTLLRASGGRPAAAMHMAAGGRDARSWEALPKALQRGDPGLMRDWTAAECIDVLHKICHDLLLVRHGAAPRFFALASLPAPGPDAVLSGWARDLSRSMRTMEHPFNGGLMQEALVSQARIALNSQP